MKKTLAKRAARATARHTAKGTASKLKREPARAAMLLGIGAFAGFLIAKLLASSPDRPSTPASVSAQENNPIAAATPPAVAGA